MKISNKGRYALQLMLDLANHNTGENISIKDVSQRQEISEKYLEQIVGTLCKAGCLISTRGSRGGYRLAKDPSAYTVGDILRITEGNLDPSSYLKRDIADAKCNTNISSLELLLELWDGLGQAINDYIDSITLEDLMKKQKEAGLYDYVI